jgi:glutamyl-Q tRNA(Asp) synthetase
MSFTTRFAPSPTGHLHIGHAFSAWTAFQAAVEAEGRFVLRMEDIDTVRCKREYEQVILDDLIWLGLDWEEPVRRQSGHFDDYARVLGRLKRSVSSIAASRHGAKSWRISPARRTVSARSIAALSLP